ncbi:hypothetical protein AWC38_SpisGene17986 [Stylophora pistillata]|uniref:Uncharacterized protein n=1 Tax=Stylophora pistillata TaxID=50429 RepID=A0A2B4RMW0_STYPI|nr:hypothetical protein AWC38_SpisGene17986 [Stylophora pistillata]
MIQPDLSYAEALVALDIASLYERREILCDALFDQIVRDENHKLHDLLPPRNESTYRTRSQRYFKLPICCSEAYNLSRFRQWDTYNSQAAKQANSCLKSLKESLSYINKNFMIFRYVDRS